MKLISWNVNGLRACEGKGFSEVFKQLDADFFCLQETKMQEGQLDLQFEGYRSYWNYAEKTATNRSASRMASAPKSTTTRVASSRWRCPTSIWLHVTRPTRRMV